MFEDRILTLAALAKFELPARTLRFCDGGQVIWGAEIFRAIDADFGTIGEVAPAKEESGDQAPNGRLTFLPNATAAAATLSSPDYQMSRIRSWLAKVDPATGAVVGTPLQTGDVLLDTTELRVGKSTRSLVMEFMSNATRLFSIQEGNVLSPSFHESVWPGEQGLDNATGVPLQVAWGVQGPPRGAVAAGGGAGGSSGLGRGLVDRF